MSAVLRDLDDLAMLRNKMSKILHNHRCENTLLSAASNYLPDYHQNFSNINYKIQSHYYVFMSHCVT